MTLQQVAYWATIITPILLIAAVIFAFTQWKTAQNARMAQIILSITEKWDSQHMEESRILVSKSGNELKRKIEEADSSNSPDISVLVRVANFFDSLGAMVAEGFLSCKMGYRLFGRAEEHYYQLYRPILEDNRYSEYFKYFAELHKLFQKEEAAQSKTKRRLAM